MRRLGLVSLAMLVAGACTTVPQHQPRPLEIEPAPESEVARRVARHGFPRLANLIHDCCRQRRTLRLFDRLHWWDLAIVDAETVHSLPEYLGPDGLLRGRNPDLVIVAGFSAADINRSLVTGQTIRADFNRGLDPSWYLRDIHGDEVLLFDIRPTEWTRMQNHTTAVNEYLPRHMEEHVVRTGLVDGIFYDWTVTNIAWLNYVKPPRHGPLDIDNDGLADSAAKIDRLWRRGFIQMLQNSRELFPPDALILGNGTRNTGLGYSHWVNGIMIEQFLRSAWRNRYFDWSPVMRTYAHYQQYGRRPQMAVIMANDDHADHYRHMRFALASTLMFDGYFCFTNVVKPVRAYTTARWYDEYSVDPTTGEATPSLELKGYLGRPLSPAFDVKKPEKTLAHVLRKGGASAARRVWRRDFTNGIVLVNPSFKARSVEFRTVFRKIRGSRDPQFNDGREVRRLELPPRSGAILLRTDESRESGAAS